MGRRTGTGDGPISLTGTPVTQTGASGIAAPAGWSYCC
jgi:hypothetical protein